MKVLKAKGMDSRIDTIIRSYSPAISINKKKREIIYPDSDGKRMADNTLQFNWIVKIKENLERIFSNDPNVFVAGDLLWYPVEGDNKTRMAPDAMVVFGRPKGYRGSYRIWEEKNIPPQVVFEILSPGNTRKEMENKLNLYEKYGVQEYYEYDPEKIKLKGWLRSNNKLTEIENIQGWISPRLKIKFNITEDDLYILYPNGKPFLTLTEEGEKTDMERKRADMERERADMERERADAELKRADMERERADAELKRADAERERADILAAKLKELGIEIDG